MNRTYQGVVIARFLQGKALAEFDETYKQSRLNGKTAHVTEKDYKIVADWKKGMTGRELSQKYKMPQSKIDSRIRSVAKLKLRND